MLATAPLIPMLPVRDLESARRLYEDRLGLPLIEDLSSSEVYVYRCGEGTLLGMYQRAAPSTADHTPAAWLVPDLEATVRRMMDQGIVFEQYDMPGLRTNSLGIAETKHEWAAWFKDPDGNILAVVQLRNA